MPFHTDRLDTALAGRYRIVRHLGEGGMATVYLAEDLKHERQVALKLLKPELAAVLGAERFVQEIKTTASLQHPHILPLFDSGTADGYLYYVMPFIDGETLRARLSRETQLGVDTAVRIAREVADALDYAHQHGIVHRDIKPENILLHGGHAMVADFGIALAVSAAAGGRMTESGLSLGTPHYMSPEQATAEKEITARSDIYSLGSVLYEMLAGQPPHLGGSAQQVIMKIIAEPTALVTVQRHSVPPHVALALAKALEKLPADRFDSAKAFAEALANPMFSTLRTGADPMRSRRGVSMRLFVATGTIAVAAIAGLLWTAARPVQPGNVSRFTLTLADSESLSVPGVYRRLAVTPDGLTIVYVGGGGRGTGAISSRLWVRPLDDLRATPLAGTDGGYNPSVSPDGRRIAFVIGSTRRAIKTIDVAGGPVTTLTDSLVGLSGLSWGNDGYLYYHVVGGSGIARVRETGGAPEMATSVDSAAGERSHHSPSALPHQRGVLFTVARAGGPESSDVGVLDTKTGKHKVLVKGLSAYFAASGHLVWMTYDGSVMAAPFDLDRLALSGEARPVFSGVALHGMASASIALSSNGVLVYAGGRGQRDVAELVWVTRDGAATLVDPQWTASFAFGHPSLSPDGKSVAVTLLAKSAVDAELWVKKLDRGPASRIGVTSSVGTGPGWSADGRTIAFRGFGGVMSAPADGHSAPSLYRAINGIYGGTPYTRDGKWLVYTANNDLFAVRTDGDTTRRALVVGPAVERWAAVSPDGRWLAYQSDETGRFEVYVRPFPDTGPMKRQVSVSGGMYPRWSHSDGGELLFADEVLDLIAVPVAPGPVFTTGNPRRLFSLKPYLVMGYPSFDVSQDGARFIMSRAVGGASQRPYELIVVQNFFEELRAKVSVKK